MSFSGNSGYFFQTTDSLDEIARKKAKKSNTNGSPLQLASKLLDIIADPDDDRFVFVAEAAACVRRVNIEDFQIDKTYTGPSAPLTCLAVSPPPSSSPSPASSRTLFAGSWDTSIWSWSTGTTAAQHRYTPSAGGHTDFIKALACIRVHSTTLLLSGSADASIRVWDVDKGAVLHVLKGHSRGVLSLAVDPASLTAGEQAQAVTVYSGDSAREIRAWRVAPASAGEMPTEGREKGEPVRAHETGVDALHFPAPDGDDDEPPDLWTASADKTAKCLARRSTPAWKADTVLPHPDFVRAVLVDARLGLVVTACRDEEVRVWDAGTGELVHTYSGHWEEVLGLAFARKEGRRGVVSVGIDGTVRWWGLGRDETRRAKEKEKEKEGKKDEEEGVLTAHEEAELAALMDDDDDD